MRAFDLKVFPVFYVLAPAIRLRARAEEASPEEIDRRVAAAEALGKQKTPENIRELMCLLSDPTTRGDTDTVRFHQRVDPVRLAAYAALLDLKVNVPPPVINEPRDS